MTVAFASSFLEGALFSLIVPLGVFIALMSWYERARKRVDGPVTMPQRPAPAVKSETAPAAPTVLPEGELGGRSTGVSQSAAGGGPSPPVEQPTQQGG